MARREAYPELLDEESTGIAPDSVCEEPEARAPIRWWSRRTWMRCAAMNCAGAMPFWIWANLGHVGGHAAELKIGAQIQFVHAMASFACATFMNLGASSARHAPAFFLGGSTLLSGALYATPFLAFDGLRLPVAAGALGIVAGWTILLVAAGEVDCARPATAPHPLRTASPRGDAARNPHSRRQGRPIRKDAS